jgi:hypothetical protein
MDDPEPKRPARGTAARRDGLQRRTERDRIAERVAQPAFLAQRGREGDRIAVQPQHERHRDRHGRPIAAQRGGDRKRRDHVRRIGMAVEQPVAHRRPGDVADELQRDPLPLGEA